jgi:ribonuclease-3
VIDRVRWAQRALGLEFSDPSLLEQALTHRSASKLNNERLEFLGDAMLGMSVATWLFEHRPEANEGDLSRARAALVNRRMLARVGRGIEIDGQLVLGSGELSSGGAQRDSAIADAVEALIGAVLLDQGHATADELVRRLLAKPFAELPDTELLKDAKTRLQEWLQARSLGLPNYSVDGVSGRDHNQQFAVSCSIPSLSKVAVGCGSSRRRAEQAAADAMLVELTSGDEE